jgi:pSer/pThr/pTyr-binding forkhead associated (FHA) protein
MELNSANPAPPDIVVQIVHIEGPRKGEIEEFTQERVSVGRDPSSDVVFPKNLRIVSRNHAEINREGNRFRLVNRSPNGCFVNGQRTDEAYLKQGDVITFAEGGPKVSFLCSVKVAARPRPSAAPSTAGPRPLPAAPPPPPPRPFAPAQQQAERSPVRSPMAPAPQESGSFTVQFGTAIKSFKQPGITFGREATCDFAFGDPRMFGVHAEVLFRQGQYFLRDRTESHATLLNGRAIASDTPLQESDVLELNEGGPKLRYLGTGRFAEVVETRAERPPPPPETPPEPPPSDSAASLGARVRSLFRR